MLLGISLSEYEFLKYRTKPKAYSLTVFIDALLLEEAIVNELNLITESVRITKDLVNEPVSFLTAAQYSKEIQKIGKVFTENKQTLKEKENEHKESLENLKRCKEDNKNRSVANSFFLHLFSNK